MFGAAVNGAHRDDCRISRVVLASDDGLPCENRTRRDHNRVYRFLRCSAVPSTTVDGDVDGIGIGSREARCIANLACGEFSRIVHCDNVVRFRKAREEPIGQHGLRASNPLLRGLAHINESAMPAILVLRQQRGRSNADRHV